MQYNSKNNRQHFQKRRTQSACLRKNALTCTKFLCMSVMVSCAWFPRSRTRLFRSLLLPSETPPPPPTPPARPLAPLATRALPACCLEILF